MSSEYYSDRDKGKCEICEQIFPSGHIYRVFVKTGWFRGDDEYIGKTCKKCKPAFKKKHKISEKEYI